MKDLTPWIGDDDLRTWLAWLELNRQLPAALDRDLQEHCALSLQDYEVLVQLADVPDGQIRVTALASALRWERSRLSHHLKRMETRGLVRRRNCNDDGRGSYVALSKAGVRALDVATPRHVGAVQHRFFAAMSDRERKSFGAIVRKMLARLDDVSLGGPAINGNSRDLTSVASR